MKSFVSSIVILAMIFTAILPNRVIAQDDDPNPQMELTATANSIWDELANFRGYVESKHNVTLTKEHAWQTLKTIYPTWTKAVERAAILRYGIEIVEVGDGHTTIRNWNKGGGDPKQGGWQTIVGRFGPLPFLWFAVNMNLLADDYTEDIIVSYCMRPESGYGMTLEQCQGEANTLTDSLRRVIDITCYLQPPPGMDQPPCVGNILNEIERLKEHRPRPPHILHQPGERRGFAPTGHSPYDITINFPCSPGYNNSGNPADAESPPGSQGTSASFDGPTITVTAPDPCKH